MLSSSLDFPRDNPELVEGSSDRGGEVHMEERFDRLEKRFEGLAERFDQLEKTVGNLANEVRQGFRETAGLFRTTNARIDVNSRQIAGLSQRVASLTRHQKQLAAGLSARLRKAEAKAEITIEGHEAIRSEMQREFTTLRRDLDDRVQPIERAKGDRPSLA
jgi:predicted  nucleic acid-binding Zn-ribbon protein